VFLKSDSSALLYTDFTEHTEKIRFLKGFSVKFSVINVVRVSKKKFRKSLLDSKSYIKAIAKAVAF